MLSHWVVGVNSVKIVSSDKAIFIPANLFANSYVEVERSREYSTNVTFYPQEKDKDNIGYSVPLSYERAIDMVFEAQGS